MDVKYFDNAATTSLNEDVLKKMLPYLKENYANASSIYSFGQEARCAIEDAREEIANILGANPSEIYFTSCGSESDNTAIKGIARAYKSKGNHIITSKIEHPAVLETCRSLEKEGFEISYVDVDESGIVKLDELEKLINKNTILISVMFANNEIGTIEPIEKIGKIAKEHHVIFHTDAVQAVGSINIDVNKLNIDSLSLSAHKFHGPKGIGALYVKKGINFSKFIDGGHQESNKRAGTENVAAIVGMAEAMKISYSNLEENNKYIKNLRDYYISNILKKIPNARLNGNAKKRLSNNANFSFKNIDGAAMLFNLDLKGICVSAGSACTAGAIQKSHVLSAINVPDEYIGGTIRTTFGIDNTKEEVDYLINSICKILNKIEE